MPIRIKAAIKLLCDIFLTFLKISPVSFGGGYAMIPFIEREVSERKGWFKREQMSDVFAISSAVPGAVAVNAAALTGYRAAGVAGAAAAVLGISLPSSFIVLLLSLFFIHYQNEPKVIAALQGIRIATASMIVYAGIKMIKNGIIDWITLMICIISLLLLFASPLHPAFIIICGAAAGYWGAWSKRRNEMKNEVEPNKQPEKPMVYEDYFIGDGI